MSLTDIECCNRALIKIGAHPITAFTDQTAEAEVAEALYAPTRDGILSAFPWRFATVQAELTESIQPPIADFDKAYDLPSDFLRALSAGSGGLGRGLVYRISGKKLLCNAESVVLTYIARAAEADTPAFFDQCMIDRLAAEFCIPLTENTSRAEFLITRAEKSQRYAQRIDAQQDTPRSMISFPLVDIR